MPDQVSDLHARVERHLRQAAWITVLLPTSDLRSLLAEVKALRAERETCIAELRKHLAQAPEETVLGGIRNLAQVATSFEAELSQLRERIVELEDELRACDDLAAAEREKEK